MQALEEQHPKWTSDLYRHVHTHEHGGTVGEQRQRRREEKWY